MIGSEEHARTIRDWERSVEGEDLPEDWKWLGVGCYRTAYLHVETGVVYKVQHSYSYSWQTNEGEATVLRNHFLTKLPKGCRLPRFRYFHLDGEGVMAMEYFKTILQKVRDDRERRDYWVRASNLQSRLGICDLHDENVAIDEERKLIVPIDLAG